MRKLIGLLLVVSLLGMPMSAQAEEDKAPVSEVIVGASAIAGYSVLAAFAASAKGMFVHSMLGLFGGAIVVGSILEYNTDPERTGRGFRYNKQFPQDTSSENRKWARQSGSRWNEVRAYELPAGNTAYPLPEVNVIPESQKWVRGSGYSMQKA